MLSLRLILWLTSTLFGQQVPLLRRNFHWCFAITQSTLLALRSAIEINSFPILIIQDSKAGVTVYILSAQRYINMLSLQITSPL